MESLAPLCEKCVWKQHCGGWTAICCPLTQDDAKCKRCEYCCVGDLDRFNRMANEVGGMRLSDVTAQPQSIPDFRPTVVKWRDGDDHRRWPAEDVVATTLSAITCRGTAVRSIREQNGVAPHALLLIDGCCYDDVLENLWLRRRDPSLYDLLKAERPCVVVAPDMSLYPHMPACHKLYQIKRTFVMYKQFQNHGLTAVPFLAPHAPAHAKCMASWLRANEHVTHVAASLQTLHTDASLWRRHLHLLQQIKEGVPRQLVWMLIGQSDDRWGTLAKRFGCVRSIVVGPKFDSMRRQPDMSLRLPF